MTSYSNRGFFNLAYHDSETLEIDRRKAHHTNPYARDEQAWQGERADISHSSNSQTGSNNDVERAPPGRWHEDSYRGRESIPMGLISNGPRSPSWQDNQNHRTFQRAPDFHSVQIPSTVSGNTSMRWRGLTTRRASIFSDGDPAQLARAEEALKDEMENEEQNLVKDLVAMSTQERIRAIRDLPRSYEEKKHIRSQVLALNSAKQSRQFTCFTDFSENVSLTFRRFGYSINSARQTLELWQGTMKEIGGKFGTSVLTYFLFLKWLLMFSIFSFLINFGFITIPLLVFDPSPNVPANVRFRGLELLTGVGYFNYTVMYYGSYSNGTLPGYDMPLAYFFTLSVYMLLCGIALIFSMATSFKKNYVLADPASSGAWQLLCSWDFSITNERAVTQCKNNLSVQLKESLSEKAQREMLSLHERLKHFGVHLGSWFLSTGLAFGCGAGIYFLSRYETENTTDDPSWSPLQEAETLVVPFVVSLMNLIVPLFYSLFNKFEAYSSQRVQIYVVIIRNVLFKMSILGVLCHHWMSDVAEKFSCWESMVGQALYRLVIFDFFFMMLGSLFGEFLSNVIGTRFLPWLGVPEFDVARNVFELIYAQTLAWIGIYFSPLLPILQILKCFILFYVKKVSLTQNCQPPRRSGRAAQMQTSFVALLFFPSFVGALSIIAYTAWSLTPSAQCGPFRGLNNTFGVVGVWIEDVQEIPGSQWAAWVYHHVIRSEIFYFFLTLIIIIVIYIFWHVTQGRKQLIVQLRQQIVNEGKDKFFLRDKLQNLQKSYKNPKVKNQKKRSSEHSSETRSTSNALVQSLLAQRRLEELEEEEEERYSTGGVPISSGIPASTALLQATLARQRAEAQNGDWYQTQSDAHHSSSSAIVQAMQARRAAEAQEQDDNYGTAGFPAYPVRKSSAVAQAMRARQLAEDEHSRSAAMMQVMQARQTARESLQNPAPTGSSALIRAMLARQQAQNEFDDGY